MDTGTYEYASISFREAPGLNLDLKNP
jgi:hypothetical protein